MRHRQCQWDEVDLSGIISRFYLNINSPTFPSRLVNLPDKCQGVPVLSKINNIHCSQRQAALMQNLCFVCDIPI